MDRREMLRGAALGGAGLIAGASRWARAEDTQKSIATVRGAKPLKGGRFATFCIMIRTTPWEVSRDVKLMARDEAKWHTLEGVRAMREAFRQGDPEGRLTWGFTLNALEDKRKNFAEIRAYAVECHERYGDEVSYFPGYFPAMYLPRARVNREMTEAIETISAMVGKGYRPECIMGGFLAAETLQYLSEKERIHAAHAVIWSQQAVDGGGADGSVSYPFYPSTEHFCKPAQGPKDSIDCVNLDGWTMDFICARRSGAMDAKITGYNSRRGVGPLETYIGWGLDLGHREVMHTETIHFDEGFRRNGFGWVTNIWEAEMVGEFGQELVCSALRMWVGDTKKRWPDARFVTFGEYGRMFRAAYPTNESWSYNFLERGSGLGDSYNNVEIEWFMNRHLRLARVRDWQEGTPWRVIDLTRYDLPATEPVDASSQHPQKDWSLMNRINQKGLRPQDRPTRFGDLARDDQEYVVRWLPGFRA